MMMKLSFRPLALVAAGLLLALGPAGPLPAQEPGVMLEIRGLRSAVGQVLVGVFDAPPGFPDAGARAARRPRSLLRRSDDANTACCRCAANVEGVSTWTLAPCPPVARSEPGIWQGLALRVPATRWRAAKSRLLCSAASLPLFARPRAPA